MITPVNAKTESEIAEWFSMHEEWRKYADLCLLPPTANEAVEEFPEMEGSELLRDEYAMTSYGVTRLSLYLKMRRENQSHRFSEMVSTQRPPRLMTDSVFFSGMKPWRDEMTPSHADFIYKQARSRGFEPPGDAVYQSALARFPGDPEAFLTRTMGRGYIKDVCARRGWGCEGAVNATTREPEKDHLADENCVPLAEDLVQKNISRMVKNNPTLGKLNKSELRHKVLAKHGPSK